MATLAANPLKLIFNTQVFFIHCSSFLFTDYTNSILTSCYSVCSASRNLFRLHFSDMLGVFSSSPFTGMLSLSNTYLIKNLNNQCTLKFSMFTILLQGNPNSDFTAKNKKPCFAFFGVLWDDLCPNTLQGHTILVTVNKWFVFFLSTHFWSFSMWL